MLQNFISKQLFIIAILLFLLSGITGLLIRFNFAFPFQIGRYNHLVQGHSHVAFLGWGYLATIGAIIHFFVPSNKLNNTYKITLIIILIVVTLMLISFPTSGYKTFSIILLAVFGITSYVLSFRILKDMTIIGTSSKLIQYGIYYYLLSSLATWFLVYVIISQGKTDLYYNTIYFYLHFLYNGFFVFALFGLLFKIFESQNINISEKYKKLFFIYLNSACIPAYFLSVLWSNVSSFFYVIGFISSILQLISLLFLLKIISNVHSKLNWNFISKLLLIFVIVAYSLKIGSQILSSFPYFIEKSILLKTFFIIGYLHLFTLAFMSVFLFLILAQLKKISFSTVLSRVGIVLFLIGVLFTEVILFLQGFLYLCGFQPIEKYNFFLFIFSFVIVLGILGVFSTLFLHTKKA
ncbi:hypothetical protein [Lutibacter sp.]|uniref:hypothetical protein n=1 Tax=Lutibacter sp. TaxID=1925666 RepID=UPI002736260F|nr:hypothetical protein [Lutibacter sp.]MDP3311914.1 hypothetical protein [Lutibacter sp.]